MISQWQPCDIRLSNDDGYRNYGREQIKAFWQTDGCNGMEPLICDVHYMVHMHPEYLKVHFSNLVSHIRWLHRVSLSSPRAKRAGPSGARLRALGLLLADGTPTGGRGEDFLNRQPNFFTETAVTPERKVEKSFPRREINRHVRAKNGSSTKIGVVWQKLDFWAKNRIFGQKKGIHFCTLTMFWPRPKKVVQRKKLPLPK